MKQIRRVGDILSYDNGVFMQIWYIAIAAALIFAVLIIHGQYKLYKQSDEPAKKKMVVVYLSIIIISVVLFTTLHFTVGNRVVPQDDTEQTLQDYLKETVK